jgi:hypothetical protein
MMTDKPISPDANNSEPRFEAGNGSIKPLQLGSLCPDCAARGLSIRALAEKSGLNVNTLSLIENQRTVAQIFQVTRDSWLQLAEFLGQLGDVTRTICESI